ncbi:MAG: hypothetical protein J1F22_02065 [Lachnospiraceae bacterium]|nr:hypothetical protein [Lachnospiraceae bacterium]
MMKKMEQTTTYLPILLFILIEAFVAGFIIDWFTAYQFIPYHDSAISLIFTALLLGSAVFLTVKKIPLQESSQILSAGMPVIVIICEMFLLLHNGSVSKNYVLWAAAILSILCALYMLRFCDNVKIKILCGISSMILLFLFVGVFFFVFLFGDFGKTTVVKQLASPEGKYLAMVIDDDQGALGGSTLVEIAGTDKMGTFYSPFGKFEKEARGNLIYEGEWGEFEDMEIYWEDEECLIINGKKYEAGSHSLA